MFSTLPMLGVGLSFRPAFRSELFLHRPQVDFLEIIADHYLDASPEKERELDLLAQHFVLIPHALHLSLGSAESLDAIYLKELAGLIRRLKPPWWSEHLAFTRAGGVNIGHLAPLPFTAEMAEVFARNVAEARQHIEAPLILENITYTLLVPGAEMTEAEFLGQVLERTGCGLLLDVTNLYTNGVNHGYDPHAFLEHLPVERVVQLHFVGGEWQKGLLVDSHSQATSPEVWELMQKVLARGPVKGVVLERDENLPPFGELLSELERAREICGRCRKQIYGKESRNAQVNRVARYNPPVHSHRRCAGEEGIHLPLSLRSGRRDRSRSLGGVAGRCKKVVE